MFALTHLASNISHKSHASHAWHQARFFQLKAFSAPHRPAYLTLPGSSGTLGLGAQCSLVNELDSSFHFQGVGRQRDAKTHRREV